MKAWQAPVEGVRAAQAKMDFGVGEECFYRGVADSSWDLAPRLLRMKRFEARERDRLTLEYDLFFEFKARARELHHEALSDWDWFFYMRHYGLPTRLLDGTEALGVAVFFALQNHRDEATTTPCVWLLNPYALNEQGWGDRDLIAPEYLGYDQDTEEFWSYEETLV